MAKKRPPAPIARRDVLNSPLLRKCSVHEKSNKVKRRDNKAALRKQWCPQSTSVCVLQATLVRAPLNGVVFTCS